MAITDNPLAALNPATKPIKTSGLFDAAKAGGASFDQWDATSGDTDAMPSIAPRQVNDSMADRVTALAGQDSKLNQMARTEGLKAANRRGLLNSSMAVGASQDAVLRNVLPIASQDSAQDFARNQAARAFEYGMAGQNDAQGFQAGQAALDRALQAGMQDKTISAAEAAQIRDIISREAMQTQDIDFRTGENALDRELQQQIAQWNLGSSDRNAAASMLVSMEQLFNSREQAIMANQALDGKSREQQLKAAKALRDRHLDLVRQLYSVELDWGQYGTGAAEDEESDGSGSGNNNQNFLDLVRGQ